MPSVTIGNEGYWQGLERKTLNADSAISVCPDCHRKFNDEYQEKIKRENTSFIRFMKQREQDWIYRLKKDELERLDSGRKRKIMELEEEIKKLKEK